MSVAFTVLLPRKGVVLVLTLVTMVIAAATCPPACQCKSEYFVYCQAIALEDDLLSDLLSRVPPSAILLDLGSNHITRTNAEDFRRLSKLEYLNLSGNRLREIEDGAFSSLRNLRELSLHRNKIQQLRPGSFRGVESLIDLHLGDNKLETLPSQLFRNLSRLEKLHLQKNLLSALEPHSFAGLVRLVHLNVSNNFLNEIPDLTFSGLVSLKKLAINNNVLSSISLVAFNGLPALQELSLKGNNLTELSFLYGKEFRRSLRKVNLSGNKLTFLDSHVFPYNNNIQDIDLTGNRIRHSGPFAFTGLYLDTLCLRDNNLTAIDRDMFRDAKRISHLDLSGNNIADIKTGAFDSFRETLTNLDMRSNALTYIHPGMFRGMRRLRKLDLAHNAVSVMDAGSLQGMASLRDLDLSGNRFRVVSSAMISGPRDLRNLLLVCNPVRELLGFRFESVHDRLYVETNSTLLRATPTSALVTWPYRQGSQLYWTLSVTCYPPESTLPCVVPDYEANLRPFVTEVEVVNLSPGAEYFLCVTPVFLSTDVRISQCVRVTTGSSGGVESTPSFQEGSGNSLSSACRPVAGRWGWTSPVLYVCVLHWLVSLVLRVPIPDGREGENTRTVEEACS